MSTAEKAISAVKNVLLLRETLERIEEQLRYLRGEIGAQSGDLVAIDKRLVRIETMIEMTISRAAPQPPRIEGS